MCLSVTMRRLSLLLLFVVVPHARADLFDRITNTDLANTLKGDSVESISEIASAQLASTQIPGITGSLIVLKTREGRYCKLIVQAGQQKIGKDRHPMILIDRFATFKEGDERATVAKGGSVQLFSGVQFNADLGQVVPAAIGGDLELSGGPELSKVVLKAVTPAKMWLVTKLPKLGPDRSGKLVIGETFEPRYFNGVFKLQDDGRRSGTLNLDVDEAAGTVTGSFYSDKDGRKYEVTGKLGTIRHQIQFSIRFSQTEQQYQGFMFTGDGRAIAGVSKLKDRESGFYAVRVEGDAR
jgi:hypothetical protein